MNTSRETDIYIAKYSAALNIHNTECQVQWSRFNALLVVNTIIIGLIGLTYNSDFKFPPTLDIIFYLFPIAGLIICFWWLMVTEKGFYWIDTWIREANKLEGKIKTGNLNPVINGESHSLNSPKLTRKATRWIIGIIAVIYTLIFASSTITFCCGNINMAFLLFILLLT